MKTAPYRSRTRPASCPAGFRLAKAGVALALAALVPACATAPQQRPAAPAAHRVWPEPPAPPRVTYVKSISAPADLGMKRSGWSRLGGWLIGRNKHEDSFNKPFGIALDELDNLCVTDTSASVVWYFDRAHRRFRRWEKAGPVRFVAPVAVAKRGGTFFVADSGLGAVVAFDEGGKLLFKLSQDLSRPTGLAILENKLFVADAPSHQVVVFDLHGQKLQSFGRRGAAAGEFNFPTHVTTGGRAQVVVTDSMNARIQVFDPTGQTQRVIGLAGDTSGHFSRPKGTAIDSAGRIYVVDALFDNLQIFDPDGRFLLDLGGAGSDPGEFWLPNGIAISRNNEIFITDSYNHRVQVFQYVGPE